MSKPRCSGINKTLGTQCKSRPENPWGTCRRHQPAAPTDAEYAAALEIIAALPVPQVLTPMEGLHRLSLDKLKERQAAVAASFADYPEFGAHKRMLALSKFLGIENEFTAQFTPLLNHVEEALFTLCHLGDLIGEMERWLLLDEPLETTVEGLREQKLVCARIYADVESADMGAGYQFWQIQAFEKIGKRSEAITKALEALGASPY